LPDGPVAHLPGGIGTIYKYLYTSLVSEKSILWVGSSLDDVRLGNTAVNETRDKGRCLMKEKITRSSGNVFQDLGFPSEEAEYLKIRSTLMIHLRKTIDAKGMKQAEAAKLLGVTQPRVSDLYKGKIHLFSIDTLVDMLARVGVHIKLVVGSSKRKLKVA